MVLLSKGDGRHAPGREAWSEGDDLSPKSNKIKTKDNLVLKNSAEKIERRSAHRTQWAAQFAVASELCKRGYEVAFTMGNHPSADLMAISPKQIPFTVDVKGLYKPNFWAVKAKPLKDSLYYILAFVPDEGGNQFFILNQEEVNVEIDAEIQRARARALAKGRTEEKAHVFPGILWKFALQYENEWKVLPA